MSTVQKLLVVMQVDRASQELPSLGSWEARQCGGWAEPAAIAAAAGPQSSKSQILCKFFCDVMQADRATQELPSLVAPISRGLNAAVERLSLLEHTALKPGDAIQPNDLDKILARCVGFFLTSASSSATSLQESTCLGLCHPLW